MPKAPAAITSPKIKKLAARATKSPSMLTTAEIRELGASVTAFVSQPKENTPVNASKTLARKSPSKKAVTKAPTKKTAAKKMVKEAPISIL